jgi:transposase
MGIASEELRKVAMAAYKKGQFTQQQLANAYCVHYKTIFNWVKAEKRGDLQIPRRRGCRPRIFNEDEEQAIIKLIKEEPGITLEAIRDKMNKCCHVTVIHRLLARLGFSYKKNAEGIRARS